MIITYHGHQCFKVSFGSTTLAFDPIAKDAKGLTPAKFGADIAFVSLWRPEYNGVAQVAYGGKEPFLVDGPGEYEIDSVTARGFGVPGTYNGAPCLTTIYQVQLEEMNLLFLGALGQPELEGGILSELSDIDILFVPIGGGDVLEAPQASKLAVKLEAKCIIPMHYTKAALETFCKEEGSQAKPIDKLTIKKRDVAAMSGELVVLAQ